MTYSLDMRSINLSWAAVAVTWLILMVVMQRTRKTYPGFGHWTLAVLAACLGMLCISLRQHIPLWLSMVAGNLLLMLQPLLMYRGLAVFAGRRPSPWPDLALMLCLAASSAALTYLYPSTKSRIIIFSACYAYYYLRGMFLALGPVPTLLGSRNWLLIASLGLAGLFFAQRALTTGLWDWGAVEILVPSPMNVLTSLVGACLALISVASLIFLNIQRLEVEFQSAQKEVGVLSGLLPICANCKRIRDDGGYWHQVEQYISDRSDAAFSHAICPQCLRQLYPDLAESVLADLQHTGANDATTDPATPPADPAKGA